MKVINYNELSNSEQLQVLARPSQKNSIDMQQRVSQIIEQVKIKKDQALLDYTQQFDEVRIDNLVVSKDEIALAYKDVTKDQLILITKTIERIKNYHQAFKPEYKKIDTQDGVCCEKVYRPINSVGLYVPGGSTPLISTLMMLAIPANIAHCPHISMTTPVNKRGEIHPLMLVAADRCGVDMIYKVGGAQAIAALAYGTETVQRVNKIYGPGNAWVTCAKLMVSNDAKGAAIDLPAGPSEVLVIADGNADAKFVAADLLAQAEHSADSQSILLTNCQNLAKTVKIELEVQSKSLSRKKLLDQSLQNSCILLVDNLEQAIEISNTYAPEHLILQVDNAENCVSKINASGAIFVGPWAPETLGDYVAGSNHVLPTYGYAKNHSGLSTIDFMNAISVQYVSQQGLVSLANMAMELAEIEGLDAHKMAVKLRVDQNRGSL